MEKQRPSSGLTALMYVLCHHSRSFLQDSKRGEAKYVTKAAEQYRQHLTSAVNGQTVEEKGDWGDDSAFVVTPTPKTATTTLNCNIYV